MAVLEIVLHCLIFISTLAIGVLLVQVWKYLNSKPIVIQTVLDDLTKDGIVIFGLNILCGWITWIKLGSNYSYNVAMIITMINCFLKVSLMVQTLTFFITRHLFVFNFQYINNVEEGNIKIASRTFVTVLGLTCAIFDDWSSSEKFLYLTENQQIEEVQVKDSRPLFSLIVALSSLLIVAFVQARIAYTRFKYPELQNNLGENDTYNLKIISSAIVLSIATLIIIIFSYYASIRLWKNLLILFCSRIIASLLILLVMYSNESMFLFVKKNIIPFQIYPDPEIPQVNSAQHDERPVEVPIQLSKRDSTPHERVRRSSFEFSLQYFFSFF